MGSGNESEQSYPSEIDRQKEDEREDILMSLNVTLSEMDEADVRMRAREYENTKSASELGFVGELSQTLSEHNNQTSDEGSENGWDPRMACMFGSASHMESSESSYDSEYTRAEGELRRYRSIDSSADSHDSDEKRSQVNEHNDSSADWHGSEEKISEVIAEAAIDVRDPRYQFDSSMDLNESSSSSNLQMVRRYASSHNRHNWKQLSYDASNCPCIPYHSNEYMQKHAGRCGCSKYHYNHQRRLYECNHSLPHGKEESTGSSRSYFRCNLHRLHHISDLANI